MICPECKAEAFKVLSHIELGRSGEWFENTLQRAQCAACSAKFFGVYREARSLRMDRDNDVSHLAYRVPKMPWMLLAFAF